MLCVIMGDIINSRGMEKESFINKKTTMDKVLQNINEKYSKFIMSDFDIVRGDAFEGITYSQSASVGIIEDIIRWFYEYVDAKVRISCVSGKIENKSLNPNRSDGPAFYTAVEEIEKLKTKSKKEKSQPWFQVKFITNTLAQPLIDSIFDLISTITNKWTDQQRTIIWNMSDALFQQNIVSEKLSIAPSIISKQLKSSNYHVYRDTMENLRKYLESEEEEGAKHNISDYSVFYSLGLKCNKKREYIKAEKYITTALKKAEEEYGENDIKLVPIYNGLVESFVEQVSFGEISESDKTRLFENAKKAIDKSLFIQNKYPKDIKKYIQTINAKGNLFLEMSIYEEALALFLQAKKLVEDFFGYNKSLLFACNNNIALTYKELDKNKEAFEYLMKNKKEVVSRNDLHIIADYLYNMGLVLIKLKRYLLAEKCINKAYDIYIKEYPLKHPLVSDVKKTLDSLKGL